MGELTAEGPEAAEGGRVSIKGLCELSLCSLRVDLILKIECYTEAVTPPGLESGK